MSTGTLAMLAAATAGGIHRFVHVSSLAAREPKLSHYGASKARAEELVAQLRPRLGDRPPARGLRPRRQGNARAVPDGKARPHADASQGPPLAHPRRRPCRLAAGAGRSGRTVEHLVEADDGKPGGWTHREFAQALAAAVGTRPRSSPPPARPPRCCPSRPMVRGEKAKLTSIAPLISPIATGWSSPSGPVRRNCGSPNRHCRGPKTDRRMVPDQGWL